ncbi:MAG TPA: helix-turn-helix domain-containing protein [Pseudolabrys sp.]|nr:helix-turn-helix domain-containing protein [Pseudolabrys sp.]
MAAGRITVNVETSSILIRPSGLAVTLSPRETALSFLLVRASPRILSRDFIIQGVWGEDEPENVDKCLEVMICKLRKKLTRLGILIETFRGQGYRLIVEAAENADAA